MLVIQRNLETVLLIQHLYILHMVLLASRPSLVIVLLHHNLVLVVFSPQKQELKEITQSLESNL